MADPAGAAERTPPPHSLLQALRGYVALWVDVLRTRLDLFSTELQEEREHLRQWLVVALASVICLAFGLLLLTFFVVVAFWETPYRLLVIGGFTLIYLGGGVAAGAVAWRMARHRPKLFSATLGELSKDYQQLSSRP